MGPRAQWGRAGKQSKLGQLDCPHLTHPRPVSHRRTPSSPSSSPPCCCGASQPCSPPSSITLPSLKPTGHGETPPHTWCLALAPKNYTHAIGQPFAISAPCPGGPRAGRKGMVSASSHWKASPCPGDPPGTLNWLGNSMGAGPPDLCPCVPSLAPERTGPPCTSATPSSSSWCCSCPRWD